ncbi:MAG TPA: M56 family metallopeptidase [Anaerovoracaceae bacterium]|nr:M56 family metallopeptidase [Anaerovoracaceae bacterium]
MELLLNMTIGGTVTACLILLIKQLLKNKLTPKWHCYLWIILAVRLMIPGLPESDFSLLNAIPTTQNIATVQNIVPNSADHADTINSGYVEGNFIVKSPITGTEQQRVFSVPEQSVNLLLAVWLIGAILMSVYLIGAYWIFNKRAKKLPICRDTEILELLRECKNDVGITSDNITLRFGGTTPMLQGILKPTILTPEGYSKDELRHVLIHELCHYKHKDIPVNMICSAFLCVYWFNPVLWLCFYTIRRDIEFLCDERVIEITGERKEYARTLLKTALERNQFLFATTSMQNGEKEVSRRIKHIAYFKKPKLWISALAILIVLATGVICLTNASAVNTVNLEVGGGYFVKVPESWIGNSNDELLFINDKGKNFGGTYFSKVDLGERKPDNFESVSLPLPNHSQVLGRKVIKGDGSTLIIVNLEMDSETAAQMAERNASGDNSPSVTINQNYVFLLPDNTKDEVYTIWADSSKVAERQLIKIAKTFRQNPYPQGYQPETSYQDDWAATAGKLLEDYFKNYVDADLSMSSDISGYRIDSMEQYEDQDTSWSIIYPNAAVFRIDYTLDIAYPDQYSFPGGGFEIGEGNKTKIYKAQLAVFQKDNIGDVKFLGFVWPQDLGEMGEANAILHTVSYADPVQSPEALLKLKTPYIGDNSKVGRIVGSLPLAQYSTGMELHTKAEPYGLTVNYDLTELGDRVFESRPDKAMTDSSGWDPNPYIAAQLYKNSAILLSLIDNCFTVEFKITGMSETGVPYTYYYLRDRESIKGE